MREEVGEGGQQRSQLSQQKRYRPNLRAVELLALLANSDTEGNLEVAVVRDVVRKLTGLTALSLQYFLLLEDRVWVDLRQAGAGAGAGLTVGEPHAKWLRERKVGCVEKNIKM